LFEPGQLHADVLPPLAFDGTVAARGDRTQGECQMEQLLFTAEEAAALLSIGRSRAYDLIRIGRLTSIKIGRSRRVSREALADFVASLAAHADDF
jgi:excisionase family DNA binding protein